MERPGISTITTGVPPVAEVDAEATSRHVAKAALVCVSGPRTGTSVTVETDTSILIGREKTDLVLVETAVSRRHACFSLTAQGYVIDDLGSSNGTFVNGVRISGPTVINVGDRVQIGSTVLVLTQHDDLAEKLARMERLEAMTTLAGGIAHDFNVEVLAEDYSTALGHHGGRNLEEIRGAATSAAALARRLLRLGRSEPLPLARVALHELVAKTVSMAQTRNAAMRIDVQVASDLSARGSYDELQQAFLNLCINAADAMPDGGTLRISARPLVLTFEEAIGRQLRSAGAYVEVTVSDTGVGMDAATLARAFEPFFTTKSRDRGTGLGLAMVHSSIRRHHGAIEVTSVMGRGTQFHLLLPVAD